MPAAGGEKITTKELYKQLRLLSCGELWKEVAWFEQATAGERLNRVALIRAVGVVFSESGSEEERGEVRRWLMGLLNDPAEKIRRYAMAALPKIGSGPREEKALVSLLQKTDLEREKSFLGRALDKIGGSATLEAMGGRLRPETEQRVKANIARSESPSSIRLHYRLSNFSGLRIHLRGRKGLEGMLRAEVEEYIREKGKFRLEEVESGLVAMTPVAAFSLEDIYALRCFGTIGLVLGRTKNRASDKDAMEEMASLIASGLSQRVLETFTEGSIRYRLNFVERGPQRAALRLLVDRAYAMCPAILNDARNAPWAVDIHPAGRWNTVELRPRISPDPRFLYRQQDIPAASHPPLAACMARLGGFRENEVIWDPFCGSGLELIERTLLGGVRRVHGTDRSEEAIAITRTNFTAAKAGSVESSFDCCDFRDFAKVQGLGPNSVTLIITNPPMGKRVPIPNLHGLIQDLFSVAAKVLLPGGRLVFANPLRMNSPHPCLKLKSRQVVDFGGFDCRVELYVKPAK